VEPALCRPRRLLHKDGLRQVAKRYEAVRNAKLEELKRKYPYAGRDDEEKIQNVTGTREFRRFAGRLRERRRKEGRVRPVAREVTKSPAVIITEELGKNPQEEMIGVEKKAEKSVKKVGKRELRHRIKQTPFKKLVRAVEDKARETGSAVFYVSSFKNSKVCPIHFALLEEGGDWHVLRCPHGHAVDRDAAAALNMLWKITPEGVVKAVWWDVKEARKRLKKGDRAEGGCEEDESHHSTTSRLRRLGLAQDAEGPRQVVRGAGPGRPHDPRPRRR
jgi:IS605 OrfB family transposase